MISGERAWQHRQSPKRPAGRDVSQTLRRLGGRCRARSDHQRSAPAGRSSIEGDPDRARLSASSRARFACTRPWPTAGGRSSISSGRWTASASPRSTSMPAASRRSPTWVMIRYPRKRLEAAIEHKPDLGQQLFRLACAELGRAQQYMLLLGRKSADERVASFLHGARRTARPASGGRGCLHPSRHVRARTSPIISA